MPKLLVFAPCEKIIMDENKNPSLIVILENINLRKPTDGSEIQKNAVTPREWAVFTRWTVSDEEAVKPLVQVLQVLWPNKDEFTQSRVDLPKENNRTKQVNMKFLGTPIGQPGEITINLWLELDSKRISEVHSTSITVKHLP